VWRACKNGLVLTVTHLVGARGWVAAVEGSRIEWEDGRSALVRGSPV
jgi:hypothetical protein